MHKLIKHRVAQEGFLPMLKLETQFAEFHTTNNFLEWSRTRDPDGKFSLLTIFHSNLTNHNSLRPNPNPNQ